MLVINEKIKSTIRFIGSCIAKITIVYAPTHSIILHFFIRYLLTMKEYPIPEKANTI